MIFSVQVPTTVLSGSPVIMDRMVILLPVLLLVLVLLTWFQFLTATDDDPARNDGAEVEKARAAETMASVCSGSLILSDDLLRSTNVTGGDR